MIKVIELFAGIGGCHKALDNLGIEAKYWAIEKDWKALKVYNAINNENQENYQDIRNFKIQFTDLRNQNIDLLWMSPPCQAFSNNRQGNIKNTDRDLILYTLQIIEKTKPKYIIIENVPNFAKSKEFAEFDNLLEHNCYDSSTSLILNPIDYNWPQSRKRFYKIYFKNDKDYVNYEWPEKEELKLNISEVIKDNFPPQDFYKNKHNFKQINLGKGVKINKNQIIWGNYIDTRAFLSDTWCGAITTKTNQPWLLNHPYIIFDNQLFPRKLTNEECMSLMGYSQEDYQKLHSLGYSKSKEKQLIGNSLCIPMVEKILKGLNWN